MDFASLLAPGAAPAAAPAALFGAPAAAPADGEAFAEAFAQAMTEIPVGVEGLPIAPVPTEAAIALPDAPTPALSDVPPPEAPLKLDVPPSLGRSTSLGLPSDPKVELSPAAEQAATEAPEAPKEEAPAPGLAPAASKPGRRRPDVPPVGGPDLPTCPTATFPTDGPDAPLPDCPPAPGEGAVFLEGEEASTEGPDDLDPLDEGDGFARALSTPPAPPLIAGSAVPTPVAPPAAHATPPTFAKTAAVEGVAPGGGDVAAPSADAPLPSAKGQALPVADDLGIVPQVTVTSEGSDPFSPPADGPSSPGAASAGASVPSAAPPQAPAVQPQGGQVLAAPAPATTTTTVPAAPAPGSKFEPAIVNEAVAVQVAPAQLAPLKTVAPKVEASETKVGTSANVSEPVLELAAQETPNDGGASPDDAPRDQGASVVPISTPTAEVRETAATARPEIGADRPNVDHHMVVRQVADRIESMVAARPRDGVTIHMEPRDLGTVTLVVKGIASALDVQVIASDDRVRQSLDASRPELAQALAPRGIGLREVRIDANPAPSTSSSSTHADAGSGSPDGRSRGGSSQPQSQQQNPSAFRNAAPAPSRPRAARSNGRGVDLLV